jgi:hypothetical protein
MQRRSDRQMPLPLANASWSEDDLRAAHRASRLDIPFELALQDPALEICLRCYAEARRSPGARHSVRPSVRRSRARH